MVETMDLVMIGAKGRAARKPFLANCPASLAILVLICFGTHAHTHAHTHLVAPHLSSLLGSRKVTSNVTMTVEIPSIETTSKPPKYWYFRLCPNNGCLGSLATDAQPPHREGGNKGSKAPLNTRHEKHPRRASTSVSLLKTWLVRDMSPGR